MRQGHSNNSILMENNYFFPWGYYTLRCDGEAPACTIRNNIYDVSFKVALPAGPGPDRVARRNSPAPMFLECNRYSDGDFIEQQYISGDVTHVITGCPSYP